MCEVQRGSTTDSGNSLPAASSWRIRMRPPHVIGVRLVASSSNLTGCPAKPSGTGTVQEAIAVPNVSFDSTTPSASAATATPRGAFQRAASRHPANALSHAAGSAVADGAGTVRHMRAVAPAGTVKRSETESPTRL